MPIKEDDRRRGRDGGPPKGRGRGVTGRSRRVRQGGVHDPFPAGSVTLAGILAWLIGPVPARGVPPAIEFVRVPAGNAAAAGVDYDFRLSRFEITNAQFVQFLNDTLAEARSGSPSEGSAYMYFDLDSGDVYIHDQRTPTTGIDAPSATLTVRMFEAAAGGAISFDGNVYVVDPEKEDLPVTGVSWYGAVKFCNWLTLAQGMAPDQRIYTEAAGTEPTGWHPVTVSTADWAVRGMTGAEREALLSLSGFRLPMDDAASGVAAYNEWYKAAAWNDAAGEHRVYGFGRDTLTARDANYRLSDDPFEPGPTPVGFYDGVNTLASGDPTQDTANAYGLYDMTGNVAEWVQDRDAVSLEPGIRGGHFFSPAASISLRADTRMTAPAETTVSFIGFRVAQTITPVTLSVGRDRTRITGFVGGPYDTDRFILSVTNPDARSVDTLSITTDVDWLTIDGEPPTLVGAGSTIDVPLVITATASAPGRSPPPAGDFAFVSADEGGGVGPDYDYWISRTETTNAQFAAFLNDALADVRSGNPGPRSEYLFFYIDSGDVYVNDEATPAEGTSAPDAARTLKIYDAGIGRIRYQAGGYTIESGFEDHPVVGVTWYGAVKYCNWLTVSQGMPASLRAYAEAAGSDPAGWRPAVANDADWTGAPLPADVRRRIVEETPGYRLPMDDEAEGASPFNEWYKAASRGAMTDAGDVALDVLYGFGRTVLEAVDANYLDSGDTETNGTTPVSFFNGVNRLFALPSPCFPPAPASPLTRDTDNGYGLYDVTGNAAEWVQDFFQGDAALRGRRGGSWRDPVDAPALTNTGRTGLAADAASDDTGFRVVRGTGHIGTVTVRDALSGATFVEVFLLDLREPFLLSPEGGLVIDATYGDALSGTTASWTLTNRSDAAMDWTWSTDVAWLDVGAAGTGEAGGALGGHATVSLEATTNVEADRLAPGTYDAMVTLRNATTGSEERRHVRVAIASPVRWEAVDGAAAEFTGPWGGPFHTLTPLAADLVSTAGMDLAYQVTAGASWLDVSGEGGALEGDLAAGGTVRFTFSPNAGAETLTPGRYESGIDVVLTDRNNGDVSWTLRHPVTLTVEEPVAVSPSQDPQSVGPNPDPTVEPPIVYTLTNLSDEPIEVLIDADVSWLTVADPVVTFLPPTGQVREARVFLNDDVLTLTDGEYTGTVRFEDTWTGLAQCRSVALSIVETLTVVPFDDYEAVGAVGGSVTPPLAVYRLTNVARDGGGPLSWTAQPVDPLVDWIRFDGNPSASGTLADGESAYVVVTVDPTNLAPGDHQADIAITILPGGETITRTVRLTLVQPAFAVRETRIDADARQPGGPAYDYLLGTFPVTNAEFVAFLNDALAHPDDERGAYLFFDTTTGAVYLNTIERGEQGPDPGSRSVRVFDPAVAGQIAFDGGAYGVVTTPVDFTSHPVTGVSWYGAAKFCNWLTLDQGMRPTDRCYAESGDTTPEGWHPVTITTADWMQRDLNDAERAALVASCRGYRLPMDNGADNELLSEDAADAYNEWYKAAAWNDALRRPTLYGFGRDVLTPADANYLGSGDPFDDGTTPVGFYDGSTRDGGFVTGVNGNGFGLFDMTGNVYEWLQDRFSPQPGGIAFRAIRGGSWRQPVDAPDLRTDARNFAPVEGTDAEVGFRVARTLPPVGADYDGNGAVDAGDFLILAACLRGPSATGGTGCTALDLTGDADVDLEDFARLQVAYTGP
ncbi:MAG: hypothetical protein D6788_03280 [Planctomycetota bacterium]|nr:MAG: hypothetical protein D6788_03280 [Planctomycetota bacterium]